jgi:hypothetical protein
MIEFEDTITPPKNMAAPTSVTIHTDLFSGAQPYTIKPRESSLHRNEQRHSIFWRHLAMGFGFQMAPNSISQRTTYLRCNCRANPRRYDADRLQSRTDGNVLSIFLQKLKGEAICSTIISIRKRHLQHDGAGGEQFQRPHEAGPKVL